jgi:membrane protein
MSATMRAMNRAYDIEETRPFWKRTGLSIGLTLLTGIFFIAAFVLAVAGQAIASTVADALRLDAVYEAVIGVVRFVGIVLGLLVAVAVVYWAAPNAKLPFKFITPGAALFMVVWLVGSFAFAWYVSRFGSYNATYGTLGGVVVLMVWFYLTAYMLLAGAELNALLARKADPANVEGPQPEVAAHAVTNSGPSRRPRMQAGTASTGAPRPTAPSARGDRALRTLVALTGLWRATGSPSRQGRTRTRVRA